MKAKELRDLSVDELQKKVDGAESGAVQPEVSAPYRSSGKLAHAFLTVRRDIARVKTVLREKQG